MNINTDEFLTPYPFIIMVKAKKASPAHLPWHHQVCAHGYRSYSVYDRDWNFIAEVPDERHARRIVQACNSHKGLLEACQLAVLGMKEALDGSNPGWMDNMRADLALVERAIDEADRIIPKIAHGQTA